MNYNKNILNLTIITIVIFIVICMLYKDNVHNKKLFHNPYDKKFKYECGPTENNKVLNNTFDDIFDYIKSFFLF